MPCSQRIRWREASSLGPVPDGGRGLLSLFASVGAGTRFVLRKTWRYYRPIHHAWPSTNAIALSPIGTLSARPCWSSSASPEHFHLRASPRLRASQRLLDQSSPHSLP